MYKKFPTGEIIKHLVVQDTGLVLVYFLYRNYRIISNFSRIYKNVSIRHLGRIACEKKHMGLDGVLSGCFAEVLASVWADYIDEGVEFPLTPPG